MTSNIPNSRSFPFSAVGIVGDTIGGVAQHGSGVLIAPDELLTASHVVWTQGVGPASTSQMIVIPDLNGTDEPFGEIGVTNYHYFQVRDAGDTEPLVDRQADFALLHLARTVSGAGVMTPVANFSGGTVHITGYPDSAGITSMVDSAQSVSAEAQTSTLLNSIDTGNGTSGGPVWQQTASGTAQVFGVVSSNRDAEISAPILQLLNQWIAADHAGGQSGAIAVPIPLVLHPITPDAGAPGVDAREAALVDTFSYRNNNSDVAISGIDPALHFASWGWREGRAPDPVFDPRFYLAHNSDVAAAGIDPLLHYAAFGWHEGRDPSASFSTNGYLAANPDVRLAGINPLQHYLDYGVTEGRAV